MRDRSTNAHTNTYKTNAMKSNANATNIHVALNRLNAHIRLLTFSETTALSDNINAVK